MYEILTYDTKSGLWRRDGLVYRGADLARRQARKMAKTTSVRIEPAVPITSRLVMA